MFFVFLLVSLLAALVSLPPLSSLLLAHAPSPHCRCRKIFFWKFQAAAHCTLVRDVESGRSYLERRFLLDAPPFILTGYHLLCLLQWERGLEGACYRCAAGVFLAPLSEGWSSWRDRQLGRNFCPIMPAVLTVLWRSVCVSKYWSS